MALVPWREKDGENGAGKKVTNRWTTIKCEMGYSIGWKWSGYNVQKSGMHGQISAKEMVSKVVNEGNVGMNAS